MVLVLLWRWWDCCGSEKTFCDELHQWWPYKTRPALPGRFYLSEDEDATATGRVQMQFLNFWKAGECQSGIDVDICWHMLTPGAEVIWYLSNGKKITLLRNPMIVDLGSEWQCVEPSDTCPTNIMAGAMVLILQVIIRSGNWHSEWFHHDFPFQVATFQYTNLWNRPHQQRAILMFFLISLIT